MDLVWMQDISIQKLLVVQYNTPVQVCYWKVQDYGLGHLVLGQSGVAKYDWGKCPNCVCVCEEGGGGEFNMVNVWLLKNYCVELESHSMCDVAATSPQMKSYPAMLVFELNNWGKAFRLYCIAHHWSHTNVFSTRTPSRMSIKNRLNDIMKI